MPDLRSERAGRVTRAALGQWRPAPVPEPRLDPAVFGRPALERSAVILLHALARLEYALSPGGLLRAWAKLCLRLCLILACPALLVVPALAVLACGFADLTAALALACSNLLSILLRLAAFAAAAALALAFVRSRR